MGHRGKSRFPNGSAALAIIRILPASTDPCPFHLAAVPAQSKAKPLPADCRQEVKRPDLRFAKAWSAHQQKIAWGGGNRLCLPTVAVGANAELAIPGDGDNQP